MSSPLRPRLPATTAGHRQPSQPGAEAPLGLGGSSPPRPKKNYGAPLEPPSFLRRKEKKEEEGEEISTPPTSGRECNTPFCVHARHPVHLSALWPLPTRCWWWVLAMLMVPSLSLCRPHHVKSNFSNSPNLKPLLFWVGLSNFLALRILLSTPIIVPTPSVP